MEDFSLKILVAAPDIADPYFSKSVLLVLTETPQDPDQYLGLFLNKSMHLSLKDQFEKYGGIHFPDELRPLPIYAGGPIRTDYICMLHSADYQTDSTVTLGEDVSFTPALENELKHVVYEKTPRDVFMAIGACLCLKKTVRAALESGYWNMLPFDKDIVFAKDRETLWEDCTRLLQAKRPGRSCSLSGLMMRESPSNKIC